jgi:hypothetical protein
MTALLCVLVGHEYRDGHAGCRRPGCEPADHHKQALEAAVAALSDYYKRKGPKAMARPTTGARIVLTTYFRALGRAER